MRVLRPHRLGGLLLVLVCALVLGPATAEEPRLSGPPLISVIADPASFVEKKLLLNGYFTDSFQLYLTSEHAAGFDQSAYIEIEPPPDNVGYVYMRDICSGFRVSIWGTFRSYRDNSNNRRYALQDVDRMDVHPIDPDEPGKLQKRFNCWPMSDPGRRRARELKRTARERAKAIAHRLAGSPPAIPRCLADAPNPNHESAKQFLESDVVITTAASPDARVEVLITLDRPDLDDAHLPYEKKLELRSTYREPTRSGLGKLGAEIVREGSAYFQANVPAQHVPNIYCWPDVRHVSVTTPYWKVVEPFWDTDAVGSMECPIVAGACPRHCNLHTGRLYEAERHCWSEIAGPVVCDLTRAMMTIADFKCSVRLSTGEIVNSSSFHLIEPAFKGWRRCTNEEHMRVRGAQACE